MRVVTGNPIYKAIKHDTIKSLIDTACESYPEMDAFIFRRVPNQAEIHKTFAEFGDDIRSLSTFILNSKYKGDRLGVVGENAYEWMLSYISILSSDSVAVPLDRMLPEEELISLLQRSETKILFYHPKHHKIMASIAKKLDNGEIKLPIELFVCFYADGLPKGETFPIDDPRFRRIEELITTGREFREKGDRSYEECFPSVDEMRILLFTSGTTSQSKGVMLTNKSIASNVYAITQTLFVTKGYRAFSILPMHHTFENTCSLFILSTGAALCLADGLRYIVKNLQEWKPDCGISVPLLYENIYTKIVNGIRESGKEDLIKVLIPITKVLKKFGIDLRRAIFKDVLDKLGGNLKLVVIGGAPIDKKYIDFFSDFGIDFFMGYGLTETSPVISVTNVECNVRGSVGRPMVGISAAIDGSDDSKKEQVGEIITKSDCLMLGYYNNEEATSEVIDENGWFHTGDMGYIDRKGCIHVTGRVKSMIVLTNGKKVFPEEIESLIADIDGVKESFVWGWNNERNAVDVVALILIDRERICRILDKINPTESEISMYLGDQIKLVNHKMPSYKSVHHFIYTEQDMIKTTSLKIKRYKQQEAIMNVLNAKNKSMKEIDGTNFDIIDS